MSVDRAINKIFEKPEESRTFLTARGKVKQYEIIIYLRNVIINDPVKRIKNLSPVIIVEVYDQQQLVSTDSEIYSDWAVARRYFDDELFRHDLVLDSG